MIGANLLSTLVLDDHLCALPEDDTPRRGLRWSGKERVSEVHPVPQFLPSVEESHLCPGRGCGTSVHLTVCGPHLDPDDYFSLLGGAGHRLSPWWGPSRRSEDSPSQLGTRDPERFDSQRSPKGCLRERQGPPPTDLGTRHPRRSEALRNVFPSLFPFRRHLNFPGLTNPGPGPHPLSGSLLHVGRVPVCRSVTTGVDHLVGEILW